MRPLLHDDGCRCDFVVADNSGSDFWVCLSISILLANSTNGGVRRSLASVLARGRSFDSLDGMSCGGDGFTVSNFVLLYSTDFPTIVRIRSNNGARKVTS